MSSAVDYAFLHGAGEGGWLWDDLIAAMQLQLKKLDDQQRKTTDMVASVQRSVSSLQSGLAKRVEDNEKAIEAIDAYRLQINSRLAEINARLQANAQPSG